MHSPQAQGPGADLQFDPSKTRASHFSGEALFFWGPRSGASRHAANSPPSNRGDEAPDDARGIEAGDFMQEGFEVHRRGPIRAVRHGA